ncbi:DUF423 domain-containing protein [Myxacorys almedinensis]|uniref:DUF423 domain-containing protein n=1 Tax=Myxacorys almedinensis A TaxID=2690445 RepID=A0A8J8CMI9_9CYAN|nr:DUF423 domain-containing protein [Myxacorys almedinensis]NDJ17327.1 DUF423 domain-containing protein [Myxacorys almedinensis A]
MDRLFLMLGAILGAISVAAGAFATHSLRETLSERMLEIFETGARYQMYHALALLAVGILFARPTINSMLLTASGISFVVGIGLFSGSLYALSLLGIRQLGAVAPLGGIALIVGWISLAIACAKL